jgi:F-type H+-transporting ATPase subunit b
MESLGFHWPSLIVYLVNFLIVLGVLYKMGYKPILRMLDERSKKIESSLAAAEKASKESADSQDRIKKELNEARQEGQKLMAQAKKIADRYRHEEIEKIKLEIQAVTEKAHQGIEHDRQAASAYLQEQFADLVLMAAGQVVERSLNPDMHKDLIEKAVSQSSKFKN